MSTAPWDFGIQKELEMVDSRLREMVKSEENTLTEASLHVIEAGGKRLRPTVTILAYKALGGENTNDIVDIATGFELIHSATLVHDDINDGGLTRRGRETVFKKYGLHDAIVTGDFLFVKAFGLGGRFDKSIVQTTADACAKVAEGEILQNRFKHKLSLSVDAYLQIIENKTAQPIRAGAMVGAYLAHGTVDQVQAMGGYGLKLGIAFQIVDDILDFTGDPARTGKPKGTDLKEGCLTLPSLLALGGSEPVKRKILRVVSLENPTLEDMRECADLVVKSGAIDKARAMGTKYGTEALGYLDHIPESRHTKSMKDLVARVLNRDA